MRVFEEPHMRHAIITVRHRRRRLRQFQFSTEHCELAKCDLLLVTY